MTLQTAPHQFALFGQKQLFQFVVGHVVSLGRLQYQQERLELFTCGLIGISLLDTMSISAWAGISMSPP